MSERHEGSGGEGGFKIVDKRRFTSSGDVRPGVIEEDRKPVPVSEPAPARATPAADAQGGEPARSVPAPKTSQVFLSFVASLATNALAALGALPEARARGLPVDPELAREYIEILAVLESKTRGNLSAEEADTLHRMVSELKLQFVEMTKRASGIPAAGMPPIPGGRR